MDGKEKLYNELCDQADVILNKFNPCEVKDGKCKRGYFCCDGCKYLKSNGCSIRSLFCKIWICEESWNTRSDEWKKEYKDKVAPIIAKAIDNNFVLVRGSYQEIVDVSNGKIFPQKHLYFLFGNYVTLNSVHYTHLC